MRVLIGAPIHISKDYSAKRWLESISKQDYPFDLFLVDNSPGMEYVAKMNQYCQEIGLKNYQIIHLDIPQEKQTDENIHELIHERIIRCEEMIREHFLKSGYDAWFFWESDILIPPDGLSKLVNLMELANLMVVIHNCWVNNIPNQVNYHFGITLFRRDCLEKYSFIPDFNAKDTPPSWYEAEEWYRQRLKNDGCPMSEIAGLIEPVYHLDK